VEALEGIVFLAGSELPQERLRGLVIAPGDFNKLQDLFRHLSDESFRKIDVHPTSGFTLTSTPGCCIILELLNQFLPKAPEAESIQLFLWRTLQDQVEH
jgi:hypothetical protein